MADSVRSKGPLARLHAWLSAAGPPCKADLVFVLAGKMARKEYALELFREKSVAAILLSVGRFEIRRFSKLPLPAPLDLLELAQQLPPLQRHYFVFFNRQDVQVEHIPPALFGTLTELRSFARWLSGHPEIRAILVVSSDFHLRRIRLCCRSLLPRTLQLSFLAVPPAYDPSSNRASPLQDFQELMKVLAYWILLKFRRD